MKPKAKITRTARASRLPGKGTVACVRCGVETLYTASAPLSEQKCLPCVWAHSATEAGYEPAPITLHVRIYAAGVLVAEAEVPGGIKGALSAPPPPRRRTRP